MQEARRAEPSASYEQVAKEFRYALDYLKQSIEINEKLENPDCDMDELKRLLDLNLEETGAVSESEEAELFEILQGKGADKSVTNLSEYFLITHGVQGESKVSIHGPNYLFRVQMA